MHHTNTRAPSTPARSVSLLLRESSPQICPRASRCQDASAAHGRLRSGLFTHVDRDEVVPSFIGLFARSWFKVLVFFYELVEFFFQRGKAALAAEAGDEAVRLFSCNEVSLPCLNTDFLHYHMQSAWPFNASVTLSTLQRRWEEEKCIKYHDSLSC